MTKEHAMERLIGKEVAKKWGLSVYFLDEKCPEGHHGWRYLPEDMCLECWQIKTEKLIKQAELEVMAQIGYLHLADRDIESKMTAAEKRKSFNRNEKGAYTKAEVLLLLEAQNNRCAYARKNTKPTWCRGRITIKTCHRDHIEPVASGGCNWGSNIQLLCQPCNSRKHAKDPIVFAREIGLLL